MMIQQTLHQLPLTLQFVMLRFQLMGPGNDGDSALLSVQLQSFPLIVLDVDIMSRYCQGCTNYERLLANHICRNNHAAMELSGAKKIFQRFI